MYVLTLWDLVMDICFDKLALAQEMDWCLIGTKPLPEPILTYHWLDSLSNKLLVRYESKIIFIDNNALQNVVCKMVAILF